MRRSTKEVCIQRAFFGVALVSIMILALICLFLFLEVV